MLTRCRSFVEFETAADLKSAVEKLDGREFKGVTVHCTADVIIPSPLLYRELFGLTSIDAT